MVVAIDIGNTNIVIGVFKGGRIVKIFRFATHLKKRQLYRKIKSCFSSSGIDPGEIEAALICSVVLKVSRDIVGILKSHFAIKVFLLGRDIVVPMSNLYKDPRQVGQDRLANAYACLKLYGKPAIIVDFGTAITIDYIDKNGAYRGGLITPGAKITTDALAARTALLPRVDLKRPKDLIGRDTVESIRSGIAYGLSAMCDGIIDRIKNRYPGRTVVVATGGLVPFFAPFCRGIDHIDKELTLKGIYHIYSRMKQLCK